MASGFTSPHGIQVNMRGKYKWPQGSIRPVKYSSKFCFSAGAAARQCYGAGCCDGSSAVNLAYIHIHIYSNSTFKVYKFSSTLSTFRADSDVESGCSHSMNWCYNAFKPLPTNWYTFIYLLIGHNWNYSTEKMLS